MFNDSLYLTHSPASQLLGHVFGAKNPDSSPLSSRTATALITPINTHADKSIALVYSHRTYIF
jgi:hypothetical protein